MKKLLLTLCIVFTATLAMSQKGSVVAKIENSKTSFVQTETTSTTKFELNASWDAVQQMRTAAANTPTMKFTIIAKSNNVYDCELVTTEQNHVEYVHKMFLTLGINKISFDGKESSLDELPNILNGLK